MRNLPISGYDSKEWGIFLLLAIVPTIAHVIYNFLLKYVNSATISMSVLFEPIGATILAAILLDETVVGLQIAGGFFVLLDPHAAKAAPADDENSSSMYT